MWERCWRRSSAVESTGSSSRGPWLSSGTHTEALNCNSSFGVSDTSSGPWVHRMHAVHRYKHSQNTYTYTHKIKWTESQKKKSVEKLSGGAAFAHTSKDLVCTRKNWYLKICPGRMCFFCLFFSFFAMMFHGFVLSLTDANQPHSVLSKDSITSLCGTAYAGFYRLSDFFWCKHLSPGLVKIFYLWTPHVNHYCLNIWSISMNHNF